MLLCYTPQGDARRPLQASHLLEGPIGLRRNWNHRFLTLESDWGNKMRHACAGALIRRLASDMLPPDVSTVTQEHLAESQTTGSRWSVTGGQFSAASSCTCHKAKGCVRHALKMGMQVRRMLKGNMACPTDKSERSKWADEEALLQAIVLSKLLDGKTKWYTIVYPPGQAGVSPPSKAGAAAVRE